MPETEITETTEQFPTAAEVLTELTDWFGADHRDAIAAVLKPYTDIWGDQGASCILDDARYSVHNIVCDRSHGDRSLRAYNFLAKAGVYPDAAEELSCRGDHERYYRRPLPPRK